MDGVLVSAAVAQLDAALDVLLGLDLTMIGSAELAGLARHVETARRRFVAVDHRLLSEVDQRGVAGEYGRAATVELLTSTLRVAPGEAKARVAQALATQPTVLPAGAVAAPVLPRCAEAVATGEISAAHVTVIAKVIDKVPPRIAYEAGPVVETMLVEASRHQHPGQVAQTGAMLQVRLDPDGTEPREDELERRRGFSLHRRGDGSFRPSGQWTPELTALWQPILDSLAAPQPSVDGLPDERSPARRRHDAMAEAAVRLLRSGTLPSSKGCR